jgi:hypothetical protein
MKLKGNLHKNTFKVTVVSSNKSKTNTTSMWSWPCECHSPSIKPLPSSLTTWAPNNGCVYNNLHKISDKQSSKNLCPEFLKSKHLTIIMLARIQGTCFYWKKTCDGNVHDILLYPVLQLKFNITPIVARQIGLMSIMLNFKCKTHGYILIP